MHAHSLGGRGTEASPPHPTHSNPSADASTDFSKMRVSQLKQILESRRESCRECVEKQDYVRRIKQVFGVADPVAASQRVEL